MTSFVDTSVLVRYLTGDPPDMLESSRRIVDGVDPLAVTDVVLAETAYVLLSFYGVPRQVAFDALVDLVRKRNIHLHGHSKDSVVAALLLCRPSGRVSLPDALLWAAARDAGSSHSPSVVYSFDERFPQEGVQVRRVAAERPGNA